MKYCPKCENKLIEGLKYCFKCGADVDVNSVKLTKDKTVKENVKKSKVKTRLSTEVLEVFMNQS